MKNLFVLSSLVLSLSAFAAETATEPTAPAANTSAAPAQDVKGAIVKPTKKAVEAAKQVKKPKAVATPAHTQTTTTVLPTTTTTVHPK